jgi:very-short-patch-repair endonuclease
MAGMGGSGRSAMDIALRRGHELAVSQGGVLRRGQLHDLGVAPATIRKWVGAGIWLPHGRSVLALPGIGDGLKERSLIVAQRLHSAASLTGPSALAVLDVLTVAPWDSLPEALEPWVIHPHRVTVPARVLRRQPVGGRWLLGVTVAPLRTVMLDLLRFLPESDARNLAYRASGNWAWSGFMRALHRTADQHRHEPGVVQLRRLARLVGSGAQSEAERVAQRILRRAGLTGWRSNHPVRIGGRRIFIDIAFVVAKVAIEIDGRAYHGDDRFQSDRTRQNLLAGAGWLPLRFTWEDLTDRPDQVRATVAAALDDRMPT